MSPLEIQGNYESPGYMVTVAIPDDPDSLRDYWFRQRGVMMRSVLTGRDFDVYDEEGMRRECETHFRAVVNVESRVESLAELGREYRATERVRN